MKVKSKGTGNREQGTERKAKPKMTAAKKAVDYLIAAGLTTEAICRLRDKGYFDAPASSKRHLAHEGGLCEHSINVTERLLELGVFQEDISAFRVGMLHDLVKMYNYKVVKSQYGRIINISRDAAPYPGHGAASVQIAQELGIQLTPEEAVAITWHMGAFGMDVNGDTMKSYKAAVKRFPRAVILTHAADFLASIEEEEGGAK